MDNTNVQTFIYNNYEEKKYLGQRLKLLTIINNVII